MSTACSSSPSKLKLTNDPNFKFSYVVPHGWKAPKAGATQRDPQTGASFYVLQFTNPPGMRIQVGSPQTVPPYTGPDTKTVKHDGKANCPVECVFHRVSISGHRGVFIEQRNAPGALLTGEYTGVSTKNWGYTIEFLNAPTISDSMAKKYRQIVDNFRIRPGG